MSRLLAIDPGERRVGLALSDPTGTIAQPHAVLDRRSPDLYTQLRTLTSEHDVSLVVVGLPVALDGHEGAAALSAREFGARVELETGVTVVMHDERFTTVTAEQALLQGGVRRRKRRDIRDMVAATVLLQSYLDREESNDGGERTDDR